MKTFMLAIIVALARLVASVGSGGLDCAVAHAIWPEVFNDTANCCDVLDINNATATNAYVSCTNQRIDTLVFANSTLQSRDIPDFTLLTALTYLNVSSNGFTGPLTTLTNLSSNIEVIDVSCNKLTGSIPDWSVGAYSNFAYLDVEDNEISGSLPMFWPDSLTEIYLSNNYQIMGSLPTLPSNLQVLFVSESEATNLTGNLPLTFPVNLTTFIVNDNQIEGTIPSSLLTSNLDTFEVANNKLSGSIPDLPHSLILCSCQLRLEGNCFTNAETIETSFLSAATGTAATTILKASTLSTLSSTYSYVSVGTSSIQQPNCQQF
ncbi:L domain-like protein [Rhizoclosmatium globosum]|uniref:L domain-like protein n=1 Tax=Rhizoclosmatium globosum TaxID=329046 RepID=A0A1Y2BC86_9FUNG|nr:L domain-like protein [Rhizoclosmatium globosum]|eukprot:ORY32452.1 L domain-like protein [Rhizoclosmatium globosum]